MVEIWKPIKGYEGFYEVSNTGQVKSLLRTITTKNGDLRVHQSRLLKQILSGNGFLGVKLSKENKKNFQLIGRLVAAAFIPNPDNLPCIAYKDGNKHNNEASNLKWCTLKESVNRALKNHPRRTGEKSNHHKLTQKDVDFIRKNYVPKDKIFGQRALAKKFNVIPNTIYEIVNYLSWENR